MRIVYDTTMNKLSHYRTAEVTAHVGAVSRTEVIDLRNNSLFTKCKSIGAIERVYEDFWDSEGVVVDAIKLVR